MKIMVSMTPECEASIPLAAFRIRPYGNWFRWIPGAAVYGWIAVSTHATTTPWASQSGPKSLNAVASNLSVIPRPEAFYPVLGLLAAVASTYFLRRRRLAQLAATAAAEL